MMTPPSLEKQGDRPPDSVHRVRAYVLQVQKPAGYMRNHRYHEPLDMHDRVLERRADSVYGDTMIHTMEKWY
jgi:hypothetical protein